MDTDQIENYAKIAEEIALISDIYLYTGQIAYDGHEQLTDLIERKESLKKTACFIPVTVGGDPDAGFRIGRAMGHYYPDGVNCFIPDMCKSAGTLLAIGAKELIISNRGELGPLDTQLQKKEEIFEMSSGLDIIEAMRSLSDTTRNAFQEYLVDLRMKGLGTKLATKIASQMATNLVTPIASQIDPAKLGEHQRALRIALDYGALLNQKFKNAKNLDKLLVGYPAHSFVIDRKEAATLFKRVREPSLGETGLELLIRQLVPDLKKSAGNRDVNVVDVSDLIYSIVSQLDSVSEEGDVSEVNDEQIEQPESV